MNKAVKRKLICSIICLILGIILFWYPKINNEMFSSDINDYISGFGGGLFGVGSFMLIVSLGAVKNPSKAKALENELKDERIKSNNNSAMAMAFRISVITEVIISIAGAFFDQMKIAQYVGYAISFQLIVYLISYYIVNKNN